MAALTDTSIKWQRLFLLQKLELCIFGLAVTTFMLDGAFLIMVARCLSQVQLGAAKTLHPDRSLRFLGFACAVTNGLVFLHHLLFGATPRRISFLVDFVGQDYAPYRLQVLLYDLLATALQLVYVVVSYSEGQREADAEEEIEGPDALRPDCDSDDAEYGGSDSEDGGVMSPAPRYKDPYDQPVVVLPLRRTVDRLFLPSKTSSTDTSHLTSAGRYLRARRRARGEVVAGEEERLADASDEERLLDGGPTLGRRTRGSMELARDRAAVR